MMDKTEKQPRLVLETLLKDTINPLQLFIFTNVIRCSRIPHEVGYFIYFIFTRVSSIAVSLVQLKKQIG